MKTIKQIFVAIIIIAISYSLGIILSKLMLHIVSLLTK